MYSCIKSLQCAPTQVYNFGTHLWFDNAMFFIIILNCVTMAMECPAIQEGTTLGLLLFWSNVAFTIIFTFEAVVKIVAFSFVIYIKNITNIVR